MHRSRLHRRTFLLRGGALALATPRLVRAAPALIASDADRPQLRQGIQIGDVLAERAIVWARADRSARLLVEWDLDERFRKPRRVVGPHALEDSDFTARVDLTELPSDRTIHLRTTLQALNDKASSSSPVIGHFRTAPESQRDVRFLWSGDTVGQGYGINPDLGGLRIYETMRGREPDFFVHSGDTIYADSPISAELTVEGGKRWRNVVTEEKSKVAETLAEFRGNYKYNLLDENVRRFNAEVPQLWQWDDHELMNNWSSALDLQADPRYREKRLPLLAARAKRAFSEYAPLRRHDDEESERLFRQVAYGPLLDLFIVDMRSYRGPNNYNRQTIESAETAFLGRAQLNWLKSALARSRATWKVIAADMPLGLLVRDGKDAQQRERFEAVANGDGPALGRELEFAELFRFLKQNRVRNTIWLTADVHYTAAHYYDPNKAKFSDFDPFWEFVSGPLSAGGFGPADSDDTFGLQVVFRKLPPVQNASPLAGCQFFGEVNIDGQSGSLTVTLRDMTGASLFERQLQPSGRG